MSTKSRTGKRGDEVQADSGGRLPPRPGRRPARGLVIAAIVLTLAAIGPAGLRGIAAHPAAPVAVSCVPGARRQDPECQALMATLPDSLGENYRRADTAQPTPAGTAAWRAVRPGDPVVLRCGLNRPAEFVVGSPLQMVNGVQWFRLEDPQSPLATWLCVDRAVYVALTLPTGSGPTPIRRWPTSSTEPCPPCRSGRHRRAESAQAGSQTSAVSTMVPTSV